MCIRDSGEVDLVERGFELGEAGVDAAQRLLFSLRQRHAVADERRQQIGQQPGVLGVQLDLAGLGAGVQGRQPVVQRLSLILI